MRQIYHTNNNDQDQMLVYRLWPAGLYPLSIVEIGPCILLNRKYIF